LLKTQARFDLLKKMKQMLQALEQPDLLDRTESARVERKLWKHYQEC